MPASGGDEASHCFNFDARITAPLKPALPLVLERDNVENGKSNDDITWAAARGVVTRPIGELYKIVLDHRNTKSARVKDEDLEVEELKSPNYLARHRVKFLIKPFLFVKIRWTEDWGYALAAGTPEKPEEIVVSYQKIEGTSHIEHLCGNMVLRKLTDKTTDVYLYEEAKATKRTAQDTLEGEEGTLRTLRNK